MKLKKQGLAILLVLMLLLSLLPAAALAASDKTAETIDVEAEAIEAEEAEAEAFAEETVEETEAELEAALEAMLAQNEEEAEAEVAADEAELAEAEAEAAEPEAEEEAAEEALPPMPDALYNEAEETLYAKEGDLVYNNAGTVYNNAGTVYNNAGLVYNNAGLVYNNGGTVYSNGGTVYNNGGKVYSNGAVVYAFDGDVETSLIAGYYRVALADDYSAFAQIEGLELEPGTEDSMMMSKDNLVTITPKEGFSIVSAQAEGAKLTANEDGSYTLSDPTDALELALSFRVNAPEFSLAEGTYASAQTLELSAPEGAAIYYSSDGELPDEENSILYEEPIQLTEGAVINAVALFEGAEPSEPVSASYAVVNVTIPSFEAQEVGYKTPAAQPIVVENPGPVPAHVESVELSGDDAASFTLNRSSSGRVAAGGTNENTWVLRPAAKLEAGSYTALVTFTFDSGDVYEAEVNFEVAAPEDAEAAAEPEAEEAAEPEVAEAAEPEIEEVAEPEAEETTEPEAEVAAEPEVEEANEPEAEETVESETEETAEPEAEAESEATSKPNNGRKWWNPLSW